MSFGAVHLAVHPCSKLQGIPAKANKFAKSSDPFHENWTVLTRAKFLTKY